MRAGITMIGARGGSRAIAAASVACAIAVCSMAGWANARQAYGTVEPNDTGAAIKAVAASTEADSALEARTSALAAQLRCPVCQGVSIQDSPSELAQQMRGVVRDQLREGRSAAEVKDYFVGRYGEWILLEPRASGFNLLVYAVPVVAVLAGLALLFAALRRWTRPLHSS